jgi:hypothetical protein
VLKVRLLRVRRLLPVLAGLVIVGAGLFGLLTLFSDRDSAGLSTGAAAGPGSFETRPGDPPSSGTPAGEPPPRERRLGDQAIVDALAAGNVVLVYGSAAPPPELTGMRADATGDFDPGLAAAGQMAYLVRRAGTEGVQALAWQRRLRSDDPADPLLRDFIDAWLGKGRPR